MSSALDRQAAVWRNLPASTTSKTFHEVPGLSHTICALGEVGVTVSLNGHGSPMGVQVRVDGGPVAKPGPVRFSPSGAVDATSFTFLQSVSPFEANDHHNFSVEWRSPTGGSTTLNSATLQLTYQRGTQAC